MNNPPYRKIPFHTKGERGFVIIDYLMIFAVYL